MKTGRIAKNEDGIVGIVGCRKEMRGKLKWVGTTIDKKSLWMSENPEIISHSLEDWTEKCKKR